MKNFNKLALGVLFSAAFGSSASAQILSEGFESSAVPPTGWIAFDSLDTGGQPIGTNDWTTTANANTGAVAAFIDWQNNGDISTNFLVTPQVTPTAGNTTLSFYERDGFLTDYGTTYEIRVSTASQNTIADFTTIESYGELAMSNTGYTLRTVDLSAYMGTPIYIAFVHIQDNGDQWFLDDVMLGTPPCIPPSALAVNNVTATSAEIAWTMGSGASSQVAIVPNGAPGPYTGMTAMSPYMATGLMPATTYDVYVRDVCSGGESMIISAVFDMSLPGGLPKGVELYVIEDISDLSRYGIGSANNGGGTDGVEFTFPAVSASAGDYIYIASEGVEFTNYFGFAPDYVNAAANINGDDAVELFMDSVAIDVFGDINVDGTGEPWEYADGWAYRNNNTSTNGGTFSLANWNFSGVDAVDGCTNNATCITPIPVGSFMTTIDASPWVGPEVFTTSCTVYTPNYLEGFDNFVPVCWDVASDGTPMTGGPTGIGGFSDWGIAPYLGAGPDPAARINLYDTGTSDWLLSPEFDLSAGGWELKLDAGIAAWNSTNPSPMGSDDTVQVVISTDGGVTWTELITWDSLNAPTNMGNSYTVDLSAYTGASNLFGIWASEGLIDDGEDYDFYINRFEIRPMATCPDPTGLMVSNITDSSAMITWMSNGSGMEWMVSVMPVGMMPMGMSSLDTMYNATGLMSDTQYEVYVQEVCGAGDTSAWIGPILFTTNCASIAGDDMMDPIMVMTNMYSTTGMTDSCYTDAYDGGANPNTAPDVWYQVILNDCADSLVVSLCGSVFDTRLYILDMAGNQIAYNDDGSCGLQSDLFISVANDPNFNGGDTVLVVVDGYTTNSGAYTLNIEQTIGAPPVAIVQYPAPTVCQGNYTISPNSPLTGGTFAVSPVGITLDANTGDIMPDAPGNYDIIYSVGAGACADSDTFNISITAADEARFDYPDSVYCGNAMNPMATILGTAGGMFTASPAGLSIDASTGEVDLAASMVGAYDITYTTAGLCPDSSTWAMEVLMVDDATFAYTDANYCLNGDSVAIIDSVVTAGGMFSISPTDLTINDSTGMIDIAAGFANGATGGAYTITYVTMGTCADSASVTVNIDICGGVEDLVSNNYMVYPNPNNGQFVLSNEGVARQTSIEMMDALGRVIYTQDAFMANGGTLTIDMSDVPAGTYMMRVISGEESSTQQIIIAR